MIDHYNDRGFLSDAVARGDWVWISGAVPDPQFQTIEEQTHLRIDALRANIFCAEDAGFTRDCHDPEKRSIANAMTAELSDGTTLAEVVIEYPVGHKRRRSEGWPLLEAKFRRNLARRYSEAQQQRIAEAFADITTIVPTGMPQEKK